MLIPTIPYFYNVRKLTTLVFNINSQTFKMTPTGAKNETFKGCCSTLFSETTQTIRYVTRENHLMKSSLLGVQYGAAHHKF